VVVAGGGGGLIEDLTPDFLVTLRKDEPSQVQPVGYECLQGGKAVKVTSRFILLLFAVGIKPFQSLREVVRQFGRLPSNRHTREASNTVFRTKRFTSAVGVNLSDDDFVFCVGESISELLVNRCKVLEVRSLSLS
jgi:hypothetical protein